MNANYIQRLRLTFGKAGATRYIGNLDLARTLERALNRAQIPLAYTQGFNRRPRMSLATALPLGYTSAYELADIWLGERMEPKEAKKRMMLKMAPGIDISRVWDIPLSAPSLQSQTVSSTYQVSFLDPVDAELLQKKINALMMADSVIRERKRKKRGKARAYDLRPLIHDLSLEILSDGACQLMMHLALLPAKTGRPDEVLLALEMDPLAVRIHRIKMILTDE